MRTILLPDLLPIFWVLPLIPPLRARLQIPIVLLAHIAHRDHILHHGNDQWRSFRCATVDCVLRGEAGGHGRTGYARARGLVLVAGQAVADVFCRVSVS